MLWMEWTAITVHFVQSGQVADFGQSRFGIQMLQRGFRSRINGQSRCACAYQGQKNGPNDDRVQVPHLSSSPVVSVKTGQVNHSR